MLLHMSSSRQEVHLTGQRKIRLPLALFYAGRPPGGILYAPIAFPQLQYREDYDDVSS